MSEQYNIKTPGRNGKNVTHNFNSPCVCGNYIRRETESTYNTADGNKYVEVCWNCGFHPPLVVTQLPVGVVTTHVVGGYGYGGGGGAAGGYYFTGDPNKTPEKMEAEIKEWRNMAEELRHIANKNEWAPIETLDKIRAMSAKANGILKEFGE